VRGDRLAGERIYLHRAHEPLLVARRELFRPLGIDQPQLFPERRAAERVILRAERFAHAGIAGRGGKIPSGEKRLDIKPRPADDDGRFAPGKQRVTARRRVFDPAADAVVLGGVGHVDHMVRHAAHFFPRGLGRADVHAAVELHRVRAHNFGAESERKTHAERRFARSRGPCDDNDCTIVHRQIITPLL